MDCIKQLPRTSANIPLILCLTHMGNLADNAFRSGKFNIKGSVKA